MCSLPIWSSITIRFVSLINLPTLSLNAINASRSWKLHDSVVSHFLFFFFFFQFYFAWRARARHSSRIKIDRIRGIPAYKTKTLFLVSPPSFSRFYGTPTRSKTEYISVRSFHGRCSGSRSRVYTYLTGRWVIKYYGTWKDGIKSYVQRKRRVR